MIVNCGLAGQEGHPHARHGCDSPARCCEGGAPAEYGRDHGEWGVEWFCTEHWQERVWRTRR